MSRHKNGCDCYGIRTEWRRLIREYDAVQVRNVQEGEKHPNRAIAIETRNFGWILSAKRDGIGPRKILIQF